MIGTKIQKIKTTDENGNIVVSYDKEQYKTAADFCNANNATIIDKGEYYEVEAIPQPTLEELKTAKLAEVNSWTAAKITGGFVSSCNGEPVTYDSDKETQLTVSGDMATINLAPNEFAEHYPAGYPMRGYPAGTDTSDSSNKVIYYLTFEQLIQWNVDLGLHRSSCKQDGWLKQAEIEKAVTKEDLDAINLD